jgi:hypothetical protein
MASEVKTDVKQETKRSGESVDASSTGHVGGVSAHAVITTPLLLKRDKSGGAKGKKKYSRGTRGVQRLLYGVSKAAYRSTNSFAEGLDTFVKKSNKSARKRRDGLIRESLRNATKGVADGVAELGKAPEEITKRIGTRRVWKLFRVLPLGR